MIQGIKEDIYIAEPQITSAEHKSIIFSKMINELNDLKELDNLEDLKEINNATNKEPSNDINIDEMSSDEKISLINNDINNIYECLKMNMLENKITQLYLENKLGEFNEIIKKNNLKFQNIETICELLGKTCQNLQNQQKMINETIIMNIQK